MTLPDPNQPPDYLPADARAWWPALIAELAVRGTLPRVAGHRLAIYCQLFAQYHRVTRHLNEQGQVTTIRNDKGEVKAEVLAPEAVQQDKLIKALNLFDKQFGFDKEYTEPDPLEAIRKKLSARLAGAAHAN